MRSEVITKTSYYKWNIFRILGYIFVYGIFGILLFSYIRSYIQLLMLFVFFALPFASVLFLTRMHDHVKIEIFASDEKVRVGDDIGIGIIIKNTHILTALHCACVLKLSNNYYGYENEQVFSLPVIGKTTTKNPLLCKTTCLGEITITLSRYEISDLLGFVKYVNTSEDTRSILVLPVTDILDDDINAGLMEGMSDNEDETRKGNEYADTSNIREYVPGDRIKDIHWKLSAKRDILLVKERIHTSENQLIIWVDSSNSKKLCEQILTLTYNILLHSVSEGTLAKLMWMDYKDSSVSQYVIENVMDINKAFIALYGGKRGESINDIRSLLLNNNYNIKSLIRIGYKEGDVRAYLYEA
ncbi:MAG: DUF58 domain-containing protein [Lachnospiraceae bacterium]|nr:DUF58 domain-containing protein [Lachnospiraceae bacterium]